MANSGIYWVDVTFNWCVRLLYEVAGWLGITYEEINVWLFVIALPIVLIVSLTLNFLLILQMTRGSQSASRQIKIVQT
jgi:hypothetical protein